MSSRTKIVIKSEEKRLVYGEVYSPMHVDTDGEAMTTDEIEKMAHSFLSKGRTGKIDVSHSFRESGCLVVESFLARKNDPDGFILGSWVLGVKVIPDELWTAVKKGEINGFSFAGDAAREKVRAVVTLTKQMAGTTEKSEAGLLPAHDHPVKIIFDAGGQIIQGKAEETLGHEHPILRTTATEEEMEHSHRLILIDE